MKSTQKNYWDGMLFASILFYMIVPAIYKSYSIYLIGKTPPDLNNLAIAAQWQFVEIIFEVIQEGLVLPLFFYVGSMIHKRKAIIAQKITTSIGGLIVGLLPFIALFLCFISEFVQWIDTPAEIVTTTQRYLTLKVWTLWFSIANLGLVVILEALKKKGVLITLTLLKLTLSIGFDALFFGGYAFSYDFGIEGLALANLCMETLTFLIVVYILMQQFDIKIQHFFKIPPRQELRLFGRVSLGISLKSLISNLAYLFLIIKFINALGTNEIGGYYLTMHLYWHFYLVPVLAIVETTRALIAHHINTSTDLWKVLKQSLTLLSGVLVVWCLSLLCLNDIIPFFTQDTAIIETARTSLLWLFIPYILMSLNMTIDSLFYGTGKTQYLTYQAIIVNGTVYLGAYISYLLGFWTPTFIGVLVLFGLGIVLDSVVTVWYARRVLKEL